MTVHLSIELDEAEKSEMDRIARHENISPEALVKSLTTQRLEYDRWIRAQVQRGIDSIDRGAGLPHAEVVAQMRARAAELKAKKRGQ